MKGQHTNGDRSEPLRALLQVPDSQNLIQPEAPVAARGVASIADDVFVYKVFKLNEDTIEQKHNIK